MSRKLSPESTKPAHASLAVVVQVRDEALCVLLWERAREPFAGTWSLPGGLLEPGETLERSILRHLAAKVDVREVAHLEQLGTWSEPARDPRAWQLATAYLGLVPVGVDPSIPADTAWHPADALPEVAFDHREIVAGAVDRLQAKLSYTNIGFALAPATFSLAELRGIYVAALGHEVSQTNLKRVLERRGVIAPTGARRPSGRSGGRPAELFRYVEHELTVTDPFAALRPPD